MAMRTADLSDGTGVGNVERRVTNKIKCWLQYSTVEDEHEKSSSRRFPSGPL